MTKVEMTEIFAVLLIAYPGAPQFQGGIEGLRPTINLWTSCLADIEYWLGLRATKIICRELRFPPTIAEFRSAAARAEEGVQQEIGQAWSLYKLLKSSGTTEYNSKIQAALMSMGSQNEINFYAFGAAYREQLQELTVSGQKRLRSSQKRLQGG